MAVTIRAPSSTARASHGRGSSLTFGKISMQIEIFTLCEFARLQDQSLTIVGTFENWFIQEESGAMEATFVVKVRFDHTEEGVHQLAVRFIDPDGRVIFESPFRIDVQISDKNEMKMSLISSSQMASRAGAAEVRSQKKARSVSPERFHRSLAGESLITEFSARSTAADLA